MFPTLSLGPLVFPTAGLLLILGAWLSLWVVEKAAGWLNLDVSATYALAVVGLLAGLVGARLAFVALHWSAYQQNLLGMVWPLTNGYEPLGGLVIGVMAMFFYGRARQLPLAATLDALAPGLILGGMVISLADFLGGPGYGTLTAVPWGINQYGLRRHPVQLYELLAGGVALLVWWQMLKHRQYAGQLFLVTLTVYSATRLLLDTFRENSWITANGYHVWQIVSFAVMLAALFLLAWRAAERES